MGGGEKAPRFVVPDWRIYEQKVQELPELKAHVDKLAKLGLKDPWIRNEAWRFMPENGVQGAWMKFRVSIFRTFKFAFAAALITAVVRTKFFPPKGSHENCKWCLADKAKYGDSYRFEEVSIGHGHH